MDFINNMADEEFDLEGSANSPAPMNISVGVGPSNVTNMTYFPYYQHTLFVAASYFLAYFFIFLLCMVGNILVCLIILGNRYMRTVTNLFIFNLAISDLLVGIFCIPTTLVDNLITGWPFSNTVCKMSGFVQGVSVSASVFTLVAIAVERFRCIVFPLQPKLNVNVAKGAIVLIWVIAVVIMCPAAVALSAERVPFNYMVYNQDFNHTIPLYTCYENFSKPQMRKVYTAVLFAQIYMVPLTVITLMYGSIGVKLCSSVMASRRPQVASTGARNRGRRGGQLISQKKIKVIKMLIVVALLFMLSWLPLWTLMMMTDYAGLDSDQVELLTSYIFPFAHWLAFSNSSVNPIIYGYFNENFKRGFQAVCKSRPHCGLFQRQMWGRMFGWGRRERSVQVCSGSREVSSNHNPFILGLRNRVHIDKVCDSADVNRNAIVGNMVVHSDSVSDQGIEMEVMPKRASNGEKSKNESSLAASVCQAWDK